MKKFAPLLLIVFIVFVFFQQLFFHQLLPIPSDTIVGLYNPFRDVFSQQYPRGIPYKNFLITDPVRQQYPWRNLAIEVERKLQFPLWDPYNFSGTPLLANFQSAVFYPLNIILFILPFSLGWSFLVFLQPLLAAFFLYLYLRKLKLSQTASLLAGIIFAFSGFNIAWLEWNTLSQTLLWLPLIFLCIEYIIQERRKLFWSLFFIFSLSASLFAGHIQTFFYVYILVQTYFLTRFIQINKSKKIFLLYILLNVIVLLVTAIQWYPTLQFINLSGRNLDQINWQQDGWFIPFQNLIQFIAPDFFGNPATLNYWGIWNYAEFVGYIGILPLIFVLFSLFFRRDKKTIFYSVIGIIALLLALPLPLSKLIYQFHVPFLSTSQPTRLIGIIDFCFAVLAGLGFDYFQKTDKKKVFFPVLLLGIIFMVVWGYLSLFYKQIFSVDLSNIFIAKHNFIFPSILFVFSLLLLIGIISISQNLIRNVLYIACIILVIFDLFRFAQKFTPFTPIQYLYPSSKTIQFLQKNSGNYRFMSVDNRVLPPNFSSMYHLQSVEGYDPLYVQNYGEFIAASERGEANIQPPFGFNRIITPHNYHSPIINLLGVKYLLSLSDIQDPSFQKVYQEGETHVYENKSVLPRTFFVKEVILSLNKQKTLDMMFEKSFNFLNSAIVQSSDLKIKETIKGKAQIVNYQTNEVTIQTNNSGEGYLVLTDIMYPTWHAYVDGKEVKIHPTDFLFRGILVPSGKHIVVFADSLF